MPPKRIKSKRVARAARLSQFGSDMNSKVSAYALSGSLYDSKATASDTTPITTPLVNNSASIDLDTLQNPFYRVSNELIEMIALHLSPRDAIAFALTCKDLYYGPLDCTNYWLWYRIGRFETQLPGYIPTKWLDLIDKRKEFEYKKAALYGPDNIVALDDYRDLDIKAGRLFGGLDWVSDAYDMSELKGRYWNNNNLHSIKKNRIEELEFHEAIRTYNSAFHVDYRGILWSFMHYAYDYRAKETVPWPGCHWCLLSPDVDKYKQTLSCYTTFWHEESMSWKTDEEYRPCWGPERVTCEDCELKYTIYPDKAERLGLDLEGLTMFKDSATTSEIGYWKPALELRVVKKYGPGATINFAREQWEKQLQHLPEYRLRHMEAVWSEIKKQYRNIKARKGTPLWLVKHKIKPQHLKFEWFFRTTQLEFDGGNDDPLGPGDPLKWFLYHPEHKELWRDHAWVRKRAKENINIMADMLASTAHSGTFRRSVKDWMDFTKPMDFLLSDVMNIVLDSHVQKLNAGGAEELLEKMTAENGQGFKCPWTSPSRNCEHQTFTNTKDFLDHLASHNRKILMEGNFDWVVGKPSKWWLQTAPRESPDTHNTPSIPDDYRGLEEQQDWLKKWWPERWKRLHQTKIEKWEREEVYFKEDGYIKYEDKSERDFYWSNIGFYAHYDNFHGYEPSELI